MSGKYFLFFSFAKNIIFEKEKISIREESRLFPLPPSKQESIVRIGLLERKSRSILHFSTRRSSRETKKRFDRGDYRGFIRAWISPTHLPYRSSWLPKKRLDYRKRSIPLDRFNPKSGIDLYLILDREGCRLAVK